MKYAIIAAGEGSRLLKEGIELPKPLVEINGIPMIKRLLDVFVLNDATEVSIIINDNSNKLKDYIVSLDYPFQLKFKIKSTSSSMHSLYEMKDLIGNEAFCLTTVDTIFEAAAFKTFIKFAGTQTDKDAIMAVTSYIEDEKPLFIQTTKDIITVFSDERMDAQFVSGGIYFFRPAIWEVLDQSIQSGNQRMRNFQRDLLKAGLKVGFYEFSKIIDVDHIKDIQEAEKFLR